MKYANFPGTDITASRLVAAHLARAAAHPAQTEDEAGQAYAAYSVQPPGAHVLAGGDVEVGKDVSGREQAHEDQETEEHQEKAPEGLVLFADQVQQEEQNKTAERDHDPGVHGEASVTEGQVGVLAEIEIAHELELGLGVGSLHETDNDVVVIGKGILAVVSRLVLGFVDRSGSGRRFRLSSRRILIFLSFTFAFAFSLCGEQVANGKIVVVQLGMYFVGGKTLILIFAGIPHNEELARAGNKQSDDRRDKNDDLDDA